MSINEARNEFFGARNKAGGTGGFRGNDKTDFDRNVPSGHVTKSDKKVDEMAGLLANFNLQPQEGKQQLGDYNIASPWKSTNTIAQLGQKKLGAQDRRSTGSLPPISTQKEHLNGALVYSKSESHLSQMNQNRKLQLRDPLATSVINNLELLEGLGKYLDKESKCKEIKCWKHLCEYFEVEAKTYEDFTHSQEHSPTEDLFEFLNQKPKEFTVGKLKEKLSHIERSDVAGVLSDFDDEIPVGSLFDSHPEAIAKIAFSLDKKKPGKRNWKDLADAFDVPRSHSDNFGESIDDNPTKDLFEYLKVTEPLLTIGNIRELLKILEMQDVLDVLAQSEKVKDNTPLKDLGEDLDIEARVWNLLNKKHTCRIRRWRRLGNKLGVKKEILDMFSKEGEMISPTEVLINYLGGAKPRLTMADLICALDRIGRKDVIGMVEVFFPDGVISRFLQDPREQFGSQQHTSASYYETEV